jgi:lincosamide nucleotidyltransferase A/C/D/E
VLVSDVFAALDSLEQLGVRYWVGGGWGVDALVGRQTRDHRDLDVAVDADQLDLAMTALHGLGYKVETDWLPVRVELAAAQGWVDLHPVEFDATGHGLQAGPDGTTFAYPVEALQSGVLNGRPIPCLSVERQLVFHTGYDPRPQDLHDLDLLRSLIR